MTSMVKMSLFSVFLTNGLKFGLTYLTVIEPIGPCALADFASAC